jgi:hypothetical protein
MSDRQEVIQDLVVEGKPMTLRLLSHPLIDDILLVEAKITAYEMENGTIDPARRVDRAVRDYLIRLGVER